jgi:methyl coenzyme M reductase alpha subunit
MSKQLPTNEPIDVQYDEDYIYEQYLEQEKLNEMYWEVRAQETMDTINSIYENRFCYADCYASILEVTGDEELANEIGKKLNELYIRRLTFDVYGNTTT